MARTNRFLVFFAAIALAVLVLTTVAAVVVAKRTSDAAVESARSDLLLLLDLRKSTLKQYLDTLRAEIVFWSRDPEVQDRFIELSQAWRKLGNDPSETLTRLYITDNPHPLGERQKLQSAADGSQYSRVHARFHPRALRFLNYRGYYDLFLFDPDGSLLYTVAKENDYATNMLSGTWRNTGLAKAFRDARAADEGAMAFVDFSPYAPSKGSPAGFIATPVYDRASRSLLGVLALQMPVEGINEIMLFAAGMGETGETYIVGPDKLMRSQSRFSTYSTILHQTVDTESVQLALRGETGVQHINDYRNVPVISAYGAVEFQGVTWGILAEIDEAEVLAPIIEKRNKIVLVVVTLTLLGILVVAGMAFFLRR